MRGHMSLEIRQAEASERPFEFWEGVGESGDKPIYSCVALYREGWRPDWPAYQNWNRATEGWGPVRVKDCAPCVITTPSGAEGLGKVMMSQAKASVAWGKKEDIYTGPEVQEFMVLCRKPPLE